MRSCFIPRAQKAWCQLFLFSLLYIYIYISHLLASRFAVRRIGDCPSPRNRRQAGKQRGRTNERARSPSRRPPFTPISRHSLYIYSPRRLPPPPDNHHGREGKMPALDPQLLRGFAEHTTRALLHSRSVPRHEILEAFLVRESSFFLSFFV